MHAGMGQNPPKYLPQVRSMSGATEIEVAICKQQQLELDYVSV